MKLGDSVKVVNQENLLYRKQNNMIITGTVVRFEYLEHSTLVEVKSCGQYDLINLDHLEVVDTTQKRWRDTK